MERVLAAAIFSMAISILAGPKFIDFLRREEYGQHIREEGPAGHHLKQGTPTMGGLLIVLSMIPPFLILSRYTQPALTVFAVTLGCAAIGFADDFIKIRHSRSLGLAGRWKLLFLAGITAFVGWSTTDIVWFLQTNLLPDGDSTQGLMAEVIDKGIATWRRPT